MTEADVQKVLATVVDPVTGRDFVSEKAVRKVTVSGNDVAIEMLLGYPAKSQHESMKALVSDAVRTLPGVGKVSVDIGMRVVSHAVQKGVKLIPGVKNIVAVASGKGGVGKSTTAVNLALALAQEGATVGILDADIYGPSQPMMLGITGRPASNDGKSARAAWRRTACRRCRSAYMIDQDTPMVWRGPMVTQALEQLLKDTRWREVDYLIVDMPPGTGDIQLTLAQKVPVTGAIIVTTPQDIALHRRAQGPQDVREGRRADRRRGGEHERPHLQQLRPCRAHLRRGRRRRSCATTTTCRSSGACRSTSASASRRTRAGRRWSPIPTARRRSSIATIARKVAVSVAKKAADFSSRFPNIVVQNTYVRYRAEPALPQRAAQAPQDTRCPSSPTSGSAARRRRPG